MKSIIAYEDDAALRHQLSNIFLSIKNDYCLDKTFPNAQNIVSDLEVYKQAAVLMDIQMLGDDDGLLALYQIKQTHPEIKVLMLTMFDVDDKIFNAICLRADGYMLKSDFSSAQIPHEAIRKSLRIIFDGGAYLTPSVAKKILHLFSDDSIFEKMQNAKRRFQDMMHSLSQHDEKDTPYKLTKTQIQVLQKIVESKTTAEIAEEMSVSENTINSHIKAVYSKLEVHSRAKAVRKVMEEKFLEYRY